MIGYQTKDLKPRSEYSSWTMRLEQSEAETPGGHMSKGIGADGKLKVRFDKVKFKKLKGIKSGTPLKRLPTKSKGLERSFLRPQNTTLMVCNNFFETLQTFLCGCFYFLRKRHLCETSGVRSKAFHCKFITFRLLGADSPLEPKMLLIRAFLSCKSPVTLFLIFECKKQVFLDKACTVCVRGICFKNRI